MDILDEFNKNYEQENEFIVGRENLVNYAEESSAEHFDDLFSEKDIGDIKMEFTCESEKLMERDVPKELFVKISQSSETINNSNDDNNNNNNSDKENVSISDSDLFRAAEAGGIDVSAYKLPKIRNAKDNNERKEDPKDDPEIDDRNDDGNDDDDESDELSNVMSDHNYISQETITDDVIRKKLSTYFKHKMKDDNLQKTRTKKTAIMNFVNSLMDRINNFHVDDDLTEEDMFVQNFMDAVDAEDAEPEEVLKVKEQNKKQPPEKAKESKSTSSEASSVECSVQSKPHLPPPPTPPPLPPPKSIASNGSETTDKQSMTSDELLPENCSEPLEHGDHVFETFENATQPPVILPILDDLSTFAKTLTEDCYNFGRSSSLTEQILTDYVQVQLKRFQQLANVRSVTLGIQTDSHHHHRHDDQKNLSKRRSRKLNLKNKNALLATSESDTCSDMEFASDPEGCMEISSPASDVQVPPAIQSASAEALAENASSKTSVKTYSDAYDDGISLAKYVRSEIFETEGNERSLSSSSDADSQSSPAPQKEAEDDDEEEKSVSNENQKEPEDDEEEEKSDSNENQKQSKRNDESDKENDKEIERLINLNGLSSKRSISSSAAAAKTSDVNSTEKPKAKALQQKGKGDDLLNFMDDDMSDRENASDENVNESDEEITEQTYLKRYNEDFKMQLLNSSSSDADDSDYEINSDLMDAAKSPKNRDNVDGDHDDDSKGSPILDKFLKSYDADADMESEDEEIADESKEVEEITPAPQSTAVENSNGEIVKKEVGGAAPLRASSPINLVEGAEKGNISTDNSDCEMLTDNFNTRKRESKPKSLEKMIKDADKRKKTNAQLNDEELISLSSDGSDVEAVDAEVDEATKSRIIKPMLRQDQLAGETRKAQKSEEERIRRLEKKQNQLAKALKEHASEHEKGDLILDFNEEKKTFIKVHPDIVKHMKKHQIEGVKFLYDSCYGGLEALKKSAGSGCILAHCMGLGKTLQLIALLHTVISYKELKTTKVLVLCPKSTVMNWADEILRWIGHISMKNLKVYKFSDTSDINEKISVLKEWSQSNPNKAGCLLIGYEAFRRLVFYQTYKNRGNTAVLEDIREKVVKYLLKPGADLVVCDEGHIIKNRKSAISLAVAEIVTPKRVILTGTPIQNNLKEYYSMVNFIKPLFLGTEKEFANLYANPIRNGQHKDSSKKDIKIMKQRSFVLHKKLSKFVQRKEAELLKTFLPQKFEYVLFIPLTEVQNNLYDFIISAIRPEDGNRGRGLITDYTCLRKIWTHPKVLENAWKNAINQKYKRDLRKNPNSDDDQPDDIYDSQTGVMSVENDWWRHLVTDNDLESILPSHKLRTMFEILRMCSEKDEKCLIFSAFVAVLNVVEYFFKKITEQDPNVMKDLNIVNNNRAKNTWILGKDYYRLDGKTAKSIRHEMVLRFNAPDNKRARVFLISAKAGGQGINLTGANRVIILDTSWNPSNDQQNIFRIFRLGQKRNCYIYRLLAMGTMEEKVYSRSVTKQAMSFRVVDEQQIDRHYSMAELTELYTLTKPDYAERETPVLPQDSILISLLRNFPQLVYKYHEHDSLLENKVEQELSEQEKADAWNAYERDLQLSTELREMPNLDLLQQSFGPAKMPNFLGTYPGPDMASLFNYGLGQQAPTPSTLPSPHYNPYSNPFATTGNSYMDIVNLYRKYTQSNYGYPEMGKSLRDNFVPNMFNTGPLAPSGMLGATGGPPGPSSAATASPLSALGDMSLFPMSLSKALQPPLVPSPSSGIGVGVGVNGPAGMLPVHLNHQSTNPFDQYAKSLNAYQSYFGNYSDYTSPSNVAASAAAAVAASVKNKYDSSQFLSGAQAPLPSAPPPYQPQHPTLPPPMSTQSQSSINVTSNNHSNSSNSLSNSHNNNNNNINSNINMNSNISNSNRSASRETGSSRTDGSAFHQTAKLPSLPSLLSPPSAAPTSSSASSSSSSSSSVPTAVSLAQPVNFHANSENAAKLSKLPPLPTNPPPLQAVGFSSAKAASSAMEAVKRSSPALSAPSNRNSAPSQPQPQPPPLQPQSQPQPPAQATSQSVNKPPASVARNSSVQQQQLTSKSSATSTALPPKRTNPISNKQSATTTTPTASSPASSSKKSLQASENSTTSTKMPPTQKRVQSSMPLTGKSASPTPSMSAMARAQFKPTATTSPATQRRTSTASPTTAMRASAVTATASAAAATGPPTAATTNRAAQGTTASGGGGGSGGGKSKGSTNSPAVAATTTTTSTSLPNNNNMGIVYPTTSTVQRIGKADVQIIPTTATTTGGGAGGGGGGASGSQPKPFGDISPSISLTALRTTTTSNSSNSNNNNNNTSKSLATIKQITSAAKTTPMQQTKALSVSSNNNSSSSSSNKSTLPTPSSMTPISMNKLFKKLSSSNRGTTLTSPTTAITPTTGATATSNVSVSVKMAAANAVLAKAGNPAAFQNFYKITDASKQQQQQQQQQNRGSPLRSGQTAEVNAAIANAVAANKRLSIASNNSSSSSSSSSGSGGGGGAGSIVGGTTTASLLRRIKNVAAGGVKSPLTINAVPANAQSPGAFIRSVNPSLKIVSKASISQQNATGAATSGSSGGSSNLSGVTLQKRSLLATTPNASPSRTAATTASVNASPTSAANGGVNKNALNIRPVDGKPNSGVYIIETNINEKRLAIGAATKSGGGTTVTKVLTGMKRKLPEASSSSSSSTSSSSASSAVGQHQQRTTNAGAAGAGGGAAYSSDSKRVRLK